MADHDVRSDAADTPQLRFYPNGPILVRGAVELVAADGTPIQQRRRVIALCRCGHSALNPLCDGTHKLVRRFQPDGSTVCG